MQVNRSDLSLACPLNCPSVMLEASAFPALGEREASFSGGRLPVCIRLEKQMLPA